MSNGAKGALAVAAALAAAGVVAVRRSSGSTQRTQAGVQRRWRLIGIESEDGDYQQQSGYDIDALVIKAATLFRRVGIRPNSTKDLCAVAMDDDTGVVVGAVACGVSFGEYSFDTVVDFDYHGCGVGRALIEWALSNYESKAWLWEEAYGEQIDIVLYIVNPVMVSVFERRGFVVTEQPGGYWLARKA